MTAQARGMKENQLRMLDALDQVLEGEHVQLLKDTDIIIGVESVRVGVILSMWIIYVCVSFSANIQKKKKKKKSDWC